MPKVRFGRMGILGKLRTSHVIAREEGWSLSKEQRLEEEKARSGEG